MTCMVLAFVLSGIEAWSRNNFDGLEEKSTPKNGWYWCDWTGKGRWENFLPENGHRAWKWLFNPLSAAGHETMMITNKASMRLPSLWAMTLMTVHLLCYFNFYLFRISAVSRSLLISGRMCAVQSAISFLRLVRFSCTCRLEVLASVSNENNHHQRMISSRTQTLVIAMDQSDAEPLLWHVAIAPQCTQRYRNQYVQHIGIEHTCMVYRKLHYYVWTAQSLRVHFSVLCLPPVFH